MFNVNIDGATAKKIGIEILTGEACALSMRLLCELSESAMQLYLDYTGIKTSIENVEKSTWNNRGEYAVFLTWESLEDLIIMAMLKNHEMVIEASPNESECLACGVSGRKHLLCGMRDELGKHFAENSHLYTKNTWNESSGQYDKIQGLYNIGRQYHIYDTQPHRGFSNIHGFTGLAH